MRPAQRRFNLSGSGSRWSSSRCDRSNKIVAVSAYQSKPYSICPTAFDRGDRARGRIEARRDYHAMEGPAQPLTKRGSRKVATFWRRRSREMGQGNLHPRQSGEQPIIEIDGPLVVLSGYPGKWSELNTNSFGTPDVDQRLDCFQQRCCRLRRDMPRRIELDTVKSCRV